MSWWSYDEKRADKHTKLGNATHFNARKCWVQIYGDEDDWEGRHLKTERIHMRKLVPIWPRVEWGQTLQYNNPNNKHMGSPHLCRIVFDGSWGSGHCLSIVEWWRIWLQQIGTWTVLYWERRGKWWVHSWLKHKIKQDKLKLTWFSTFVPNKKSIPNKKTILETWSHSCHERTINRILWRRVMTLPNTCEVTKPGGRESGWLVISKTKCNPVEWRQQEIISKWSHLCHEKNQPDPFTASDDTPECLRGRQTPRTLIWLIFYFKDSAIRLREASNKTQQINHENSVLTVFYCHRLRWISMQTVGQTDGNEVHYRLMSRGDCGDECGGSTRRDNKWAVGIFMVMLWGAKRIMRVSWWDWWDRGVKKLTREQNRGTYVRYI